MPVAVANLDLDRAQIMRLLGWALVLAGFKAGLGLIELAGHLGTPIEGVAELTYYEPTANWLIMIAALSVFAALLARAKPPLWMTLLLPLLTASLLLSYRRSFWIGAALGVVLVVILGTSPVGRRLLIPIAPGGGGLASWLLGSIHFQNQIPIVKRAETLSLSKLEASTQDRYRLNERANVIAEIRAHPISGLGVNDLRGGPPRRHCRSKPPEKGATTSTSPCSGIGWKLGILPGCVRVPSSMMIGSAWIVLAGPGVRAAPSRCCARSALASLCGIVGLLAIADTTASFTGVDPRFTLAVRDPAGRARADHMDGRGAAGRESGDRRRRGRAAARAYGARSRLRASIE